MPKPRIFFLGGEANPRPQDDSRTDWPLVSSIVILSKNLWEWALPADSRRKRHGIVASLPRVRNNVKPQ